MNCPICGEKLKREYADYLEGRYILMESYDKCPNGHYETEFVTGYGRDTITLFGKHIHRTSTYHNDPTLKIKFWYWWQDMRFSITSKIAKFIA